MTTHTLMSFSAVGARADDQGVPTALAGTWRAFQEGIRDRDPERISRIARFPIRSNDFGGNIASKKVLKERFHKIFVEPVRECVKKKKPTAIAPFPGYILDCDNDNLALGFGFERVGTEYRFSYINNANAD